jgi:multidrug efflux system membrane fusion protein
MNTIASNILVPVAVVIVGGLIAAYLVGSRPKAQANPPTQAIRPVQIVAARYETLRPELRVYGEITAGREAEIRSMVAGRLISLDPHYRSGAYVEAGAQLAAIDPFEYEIALREQHADFAEAQAKLKELRADLKAQSSLIKLLDEQFSLRLRDSGRIANLALKNQSSEKALDDAKLALNLARQQRLQGMQSVSSLEARVEQQRAVVSRHEAKIDRAERDLLDTKLAAPFSGFLQDINVAIGKRVAVGESIGRLIDASGLEVRFALPNSDYARLVNAASSQQGSMQHPLLRTDISVVWRLGSASYNYGGIVERVGAEIDSSTGGVIIYARLIDGSTDILRPGAFVEVFVPDLLYEKVIVLPAAAVSNDGTVYLVEDGKLVSREVTVVHEFGNKVFVRSDIPPDTGIVAEQFPDIGPGILVRPI